MVRALYLSLLTIVACDVAQGATFQQAVLLTEQANSRGTLLTADFDFGVQFSRIDEVRFEFFLLEGFGSYIVSTGNGSMGRWLVSSIFDSNVASEEAMNGFLNSSSFSTNQPGVQDVVWRPFVEPPETWAWPPFLLSGKGAIGIVDVWWSASHPLPNGPFHSTELWAAPRVSEATLTITGVAVPEPAGIAMATGSPALAGMGRGLIRGRRPLVR
jgi:hypothetical protein